MSRTASHAGGEGGPAAAEEERIGARGNREPAGRRGARTKKVAILVAGMHRSGTSAAARLLGILGCALPKTLLAPHPSNERGFWESPEIVNVNREILVSAGSVHEEWRADEWREFDARWYASPVADGFRERARTVLQQEFGDSPLFVVKDPRLCRLLPFWIEVLEGFGARPLVVSPIRNPLDVAESLEARDGIDRAIGMLMWLQHVLSAEAASREVARAYFRYDQLLSEPHAVAERIGDVLGVSWPRRMNDVDVEIDRFLSSRLRHHANDDRRVLRNPRLSHWIRSSFEILDRWAHGEAKKTDTADLDRIRRAFDDAMPAFDRAVSTGLESTRRLDTAREEITALHGTVEEQNHTLAERHREITALHGTVEEQNHTLAERHREITALHGTVEEQNHALAERHREITTLHGTVEEQNHALAERHREITALHGTVEEQNHALAERHREITTLHGKVEAIWASRSWRLTRPLRGIRIVFTRGAGHVHRLAGSVGHRGKGALRLTRDFLFRARTYRPGSAVRAKPPPVGRARTAGETAAGACEAPIRVAVSPPAPRAGSTGPCPPAAMLVQDLHDGGLEKVVIDVAQQLLKLDVVCPILVTGSAGRAARLAEEIGCDVRTFGGDVAKLVSAVREDGIEVVVTHHCYEPLEELSKAGVKLVEVLHNAYSWQRDLAFISDLRDRCVDRFVAVSDFVRDYALAALSLPADRIRVIENGLSRHGLIRPALRQLARRRTATVEHPRLVCLANAHPQKNHVAVLRAFEHLLPEHPGAGLVLAGAIDDTTDVGRRVLEEIESRRLNGHVQCPGPLGRRELSHLLAGAHLGVLPSVFEGFSIGSLEYAYFGLPTVLSDTGAARDLRDRYGHAVIADGAALPPHELEPAAIERQVLDPPPATVAGITAAVRTILADYPKFTEAAHRAGTDWESYSIETVAGRYRDVLVEAAAR